MHNCCYDCDDDIYVKERILIPAHCSTCSCRKSELEVRQKIRIPNRCNISCSKPTYHCPSEFVCRCRCGNVINCDLCLCYECRKVRGRSEASIHIKDRGNFSEYRLDLLDTWFTRFDSDGDGYLDLVDVESLLKHLGAKIRSSSTKKILQICDRDSDGRLSFSEFVQLWQQAADHNEAFIRKIGCPDLSQIVKKYRLISDIHHCPCHEHRCKHITLATEYPIRQIKCKCGQRDKVIPFIKHDDLVHSARKKVKKLKNDATADESEDYPTMSKNRDDII